MSAALRDRLGQCDLLLITFDALRFDVAQAALAAGRTPFLATQIGNWEERHAPGNFTYASHAAIFAGFFPTPVLPGRYSRPFALRFPGSRTTGVSTCLLDGSSIIEGLRAANYHTICIGGVGFFNQQTPLGKVLPALFDEAHWEPGFGVTERNSPGNQVRRAVDRLVDAPVDRPVLLFLNLSATHPPTRFYVRGAVEESVQTQQGALECVDRELPPLWEALRKRGWGGFGFLMSDHGTCFGDDGYTGHRVAHPAVWTVPYAECGWTGEP